MSISLEQSQNVCEHGEAQGTHTKVFPRPLEPPEPCRVLASRKRSSSSSLNAATTLAVSL